MPGEIVHIEIPADDTTKSQQFWGSLFGWQFQANPGPFEYYTSQIEGPRTAAITNMEPGKRGTRPYFAVDDIKAGAARVNELGGQAGEPMPVPGLGWLPPAPGPTSGLISDPHKGSHTAVAIGPAEEPLGSSRSVPARVRPGSC